MTTIAQKKHVKRLMISLGVLFIIPSIAALLLFYYPSIIKLGTNNRGQLLNPPLQLSELSETNKKWSVLIVCETECKPTLDKIKRVRMALGRGMYRVNQLLISKQQFTARERSELANKSLFDTQIISLKQQLKPGIYIGDPKGVVMLSYPLKAKPDDVYTDLTHLLKVSKIG